ncbi:2-oxoacid ferredoxin oxidoreductase [Clostridium homopropionicum DSM 5847]|uniref:Indolepyruvate oxidoreductase subunit IorA n=1 Tax=Clostridium homopropionicum DSM 5847 TaxID=1121318 RepID=A0A0L6Z630_9CLOT|nr:indolepyruvate ferredoxin oxidoreductase subunit alpha [Clostridium homopropionicum]KOA18429.1 2-oxoacid ferredoxin oxidoreductase [Clostridium homopropionicum DSM 5847]SFF67000.1 indolepyruvate ferredoxin oxidoreductase alpha subunit [Clostridium homopropionicum]
MKKLLLGNEAVARGAYEYGVTVATAYPGTPSTEITEYIAKYDNINVEWSPNEKVALEVGIGASIAGARTIVSMKHVGLNVAADPLMSISYPGVNAGLVVAVADDPGQHSSQNEQDTRYFGIAAKVPVVEPSDSEECKEFLGQALKISEEFDTPVILRLSTRVSHSQSIVEIKAKGEYHLKDYDQNPNKYIVAPAVAKKRRVVAEERLRKLEEFAEITDLNKVEYNNLNIGIITSGIAYQYSKEVMPNASYLKLGLSYPLPKNKITEFVNRCDKVYVVEELEPIFEEKIKSWGLKVIGKEIIPTIGELSPEIIRKAILNETLEGVEPDFSKKVPGRPPVLCPGCHHRGVFYILKKLGLHASGDIGCYTLAAFAPLNSMDTSICMGASVGMALGFEKARGKDFAKKSVAVLGDSTFIHSGITGLIDVVYNKGNTTVIILDNSITGMTGHQENPATGYTLKGEPTVAIDFEAIGRAVGIKRIRTIDAFDIENLEKIIKEETAAEEPSLIITKRPCMLLKRANMVKKSLKIDKDACKGCKACMKIGCPAIAFKNNKAEINSILCVGCDLCTKVCKFNAIGGE